MIKSESSRVTVLSVGPIDEHQIALAEIFCQSTWGMCPGTQWNLEFCSTLEASLPVLRDVHVPIVVCDGDTAAAGWRELLERVARESNPPLIIVTSRLADNRLWAEALNLGAHDVLAKPYDAAEVSRVLSQAWLRWAREGARSEMAGCMAVPA
ncbi:MAG: response regulator [Acidobacteriia bacterium]|nr:response regulator [Terriglobia bacterium]